jgi:AAA domain
MRANLQVFRDDADRVLDAAVNQALFGTQPITVVKSPPGAGKTFLAECACAIAVAEPRLRVLVVTPGVSQLYDIADRLLGYRLPRLELAHATHRALPAGLAGRINASSGWNPAFNVGPGVVVTNADLLASYLDRLGPGSFDFMIVDEAYQLAAAKFMLIADLAPRVIMVGDPGQLSPVISADVSNLEAGEHKIHWSAPEYILDRFPDTPVFGLPVTRRLLPDTAELVQASFYPDLPFRSVVDLRSRRLRYHLAGVSLLDRVLDAVAGGTSLVLVTVPGAAPAHEEADPGVAAVIAELADRVLVRQAEWIDERVLTEADIGIIDPVVLAGGAISDRLRQAGRRAVRVDTVEKWQGLQVPISIVRHPLSKSVQPTGFDLQAGRWCVSLSRHQIGCIVVARESVQEVISQYVHGCDAVAAGAKDVVWTGFEAHRTIWNALVDRGRVFAL